MRHAWLPFSTHPFPFFPRGAKPSVEAVLQDIGDRRGRFTAWLADRFAGGYDAADGEPEVVSAMAEARLPCTPEEIAAAASERGLSIPAPCLKGVAANLELLSRHAERLRGAPETEQT